MLFAGSTSPSGVAFLTPPKINAVREFLENCPRTGQVVNLVHFHEFGRVLMLLVPQAKVVIQFYGSPP